MRFIFLPLSKAIIGFVFLSCFILNAKAQTPALNSLNTMIAAVKNVKSLSVRIDAKERIGKEYKTNSGLYKIYNQPFRFYVKQLSPVNGREVLYVQGWNSNQAYVCPKSFPYTNLSLDPMGSTFRDGFQLTIFQSGYGYIGLLVENLLKRYAAYPNLVAKNLGDVTLQGLDCEKIEVNVPDFEYTYYTVQTGDNYTKIAAKKLVNDVRLMELNKASSFTDLKVGAQIRITNAYAKRMEIVIDKVSRLPLKVTIFDDISIFAEYEFKNAVINPSFAKDEFTTTFKGYGF